MSIASIMVALDTGETAARRVRLAADLARRFEATLTGVAARKLPSPGPAGDLGAAQAAYDEEEAKLADELARAEEVFRAGAGADIRTGWRPSRCDRAWETTSSLPIPPGTRSATRAWNRHAVLL